MRCAYYKEYFIRFYFFCAHQDNIDMFSTHQCAMDKCIKLIYILYYDFIIRNISNKARPTTERDKQYTIYIS